MSILQKLFHSKNPKSPLFRWEKARDIVRYRIKYVTEKLVDGDAGVDCAYDGGMDNTQDVVIGHEGDMQIIDKDLVVVCAGEVLFRCPVVDLSIWTLMSGDGVVLTGRDKEHEDKMRTITVYYIYYIDNRNINK